MGEYRAKKRVDTLLINKISTAFVFAPAAAAALYLKAAYFGCVLKIYAYKF
jgi:hypothetical protein